MSGKISRSTKLRKYAIVYKSYIRKTEEQKKISKSPRHVRKSTRVPREEVPREEVPREVCKKTIKKPKSKKKSLNAYQKFVQCESKKDKYKDLPGKKRLSYIASEWNKIN